jgi:hypothetical protein
VPPAADPYRTVASQLLAVLADAGRPMSLRDLECSGRIAGADAVRQLSIARLAGFVQPVARLAGPRHEPAYRPTPFGELIARRSRAHAAAREERVA